MADVVHVTEKSELEEIISSNDRVVVDFQAPDWCIPCQRLEPHFNKAAETLTDVKFVSVDVDKAPWAMADYGVRGVPTLMLYDGGRYVKNLMERTTIKLINEIS